MPNPYRIQSYLVAPEINPETVDGSHYAPRARWGYHAPPTSGGRVTIEYRQDLDRRTVEVRQIPRTELESIWMPPAALDFVSEPAPDECYWVTRQAFTH